MRGLASSLSTFHYEFNKLNYTGARILDENYFEIVIVIT